MTLNSKNEFANFLTKLDKECLVTNIFKRLSHDDLVSFYKYIKKDKFFKKIRIILYEIIVSSFRIDPLKYYNEFNDYEQDKIRHFKESKFRDDCFVRYQFQKFNSTFSKINNAKFDQNRAILNLCCVTKFCIRCHIKPTVPNFITNNTNFTFGIKDAKIIHIGISKNNSQFKIDFPTILPQKRPIDSLVWKGNYSNKSLSFYDSQTLFSPYIFSTKNKNSHYCYECLLYCFNNRISFTRFNANSSKDIICFIIKKMYRIWSLERFYNSYKPITTNFKKLFENLAQKHGARYELSDLQHGFVSLSDISESSIVKGMAASICLLASKTIYKIEKIVNNRFNGTKYQKLTKNLNCFVLQLKRTNIDTLAIEQFGLFLTMGTKYTNLTLQQLLFIVDCVKISANYKYTTQLEYDDFEEIRTSFPFSLSPSIPTYDVETIIPVNRVKRMVDFSVMSRYTFAKNLYNLLPKLKTNKFTQIVPETKQLLIQHKNIKHTLSVPLWTFMKTTLPYFANTYNKLLKLNKIIVNEYVK